MIANHLTIKSYISFLKQAENIFESKIHLKIDA